MKRKNLPRERIFSYTEMLFTEGLWKGSKNHRKVLDWRVRKKLYLIMDELTALFTSDYGKQFLYEPDYVDLEQPNNNKRAYTLEIKRMLDNLRCMLKVPRGTRKYPERVTADDIITLLLFMEKNLNEDDYPKQRKKVLEFLTDRETKKKIFQHTKALMRLLGTNMEQFAYHIQEPDEVTAADIIRLMMFMSNQNDYLKQRKKVLEYLTRTKKERRRGRLTPSPRSGPAMPQSQSTQGILLKPSPSASPP